MGFDEGNLKDYQTNKYAFQRNGNRAVSDRFGRADQALELNGSGQNQNQYIEMALADFNHLDITDLTITAWIKLREKGFIIMDNRVEWDYKEQGYQFQINDSGQLVFMSHNESSSACSTFPYDDTCSVDSQGAKVSTNSWTHVAITKQGTKPYFYINGQKYNANKDLRQADIVYNSEAFKRFIGTADDDESWSGNYRTGTSQYSKGSIDDLRIYNRPLSQSEIQQIKNYQPPHPCIKTQPESRACVTCRGNRSKSGNNCLCPDGSYEDNSSLNCPACGSTCNKCTGSLNNCTECKDPNKINNGGSCVTCKDGYYDNGTSLCAKCSNKCNTCVGTADSCVLCSDVNRIKANACQCKDGYLDIGDPLCAKCSWQCETCQTTIPQCKSCSDKINRIDDASCECKPGFYNRGQEVDCVKCSKLCLTCNDGASCSSCVVSDPARTGSNCECPDKFYDNGTDNQCQNCLPGCQKCLNDTQCNSCKVSLPLRIGVKCECSMPGFYDDGINDNCQRCHFKCGTCFGTPDSCQSCSDPSRDPANSCECRKDFWERNVSICQPGCKNYPSTYHDGNQNCLPCSKKCKSCENTPDNCQICQNASILNRKDEPPLCGCKDNYFENSQGVCELCDPLCKTCTEKGKCTSCQVEGNQLPFCLYKDDGFYTVAENNKKQFHKCNKKCSSCNITPDNCQKCTKDNRRLDNPPLCSCKDSFFENPGSQECEKCHSSCQTCSSKYVCSSCPSNRILDKFKGKCVCQFGYREIKGKDECQKCYMYKGLCHVVCPQNTVQQDFNCLDTVPIQAQNMMIFYICACGFLVATVFLYIAIKKSIQSNKQQLKTLPLNKQLSKFSQQESQSSKRSESGIEKVEDIEQENHISEVSSEYKEDQQHEQYQQQQIQDIQVSEVLNNSIQENDVQIEDLIEEIEA